MERVGRHTPHRSGNEVVALKAAPKKGTEEGSPLKAAPKIGLEGSTLHAAHAAPLTGRHTPHRAAVEGILAAAHVGSTAAPPSHGIIGAL